jgi:hypothetical protein
MLNSRDDKMNGLKSKLAAVDFHISHINRCIEETMTSLKSGQDPFAEAVLRAYEELMLQYQQKRAELASQIGR